MKIYKVGYRDDWSEHQGYSYHTAKSDAIKAYNKNKKNAIPGDFEELEFKLTKKEILAFLNEHCSYPDNG